MDVATPLQALDGLIASSQARLDLVRGSARRDEAAHLEQLRAFRAMLGAKPDLETLNRVEREFLNPPRL